MITISATLVGVLLFVLLLAVIGGVMGRDRFGYYGWSPLGFVLLVLLVLWLTGHLPLR
jgi:hypothetical protein